jgi:hypothetical protein
MIQNKRLTLGVGVLVLFVGAAAFMAGRLINGGFRLNDNSGPVSVDLIPAIELPITPPDVTGVFMERRDNTIIVQSKSLDAGGAVAISPANTESQSGPQVEVLITSHAIIYRDTTRLNKPLTGGNQTIQQTVEEATLDQLNAQFGVMVWGRKSGDRIIAEVLMYSDTVALKRVIFEDCNECP